MMLAEIIPLVERSYRASPNRASRAIRGSLDGRIACTVVDESAAWVRCAPPEDVAPSRQQLWYDLTRVVQVTKEEK
jgi:hypothetical protein